MALSDEEMRFTETDLRDAFRAGWQERNRFPGLRRQIKKSAHNQLLSAIGGGRYADVEYVPDDRRYHNSVWVNSSYRATLKEKR